MLFTFCLFACIAPPEVEEPIIDPTLVDASKITLKLPKLMGNSGPTE